MANNLDVVFEDFIERIVLTRTQRERIGSTIKAAQPLFHDTEVKLQGSFATGTTVKPLTEMTAKNGTAGEYDADITLVKPSWPSSRESLDNIKNTLIKSYGKAVDNKERNTCERVVFSEDSTGVAFHADYVPIKSQAVITKCADRKNNEWKHSPTFEIINNYLNFDKNNPYASACLIILKRARDYAELTTSVPSIYLLTAVFTVYEDKSSYKDDLVHLCEKISNLLEANSTLVFSVQGISLTENLNDNIKNRSTAAKLFKSLADKLRETTIESIADLQELLSSDFPANSYNYPPQIESVRENGYAYDTGYGLIRLEVDTEDHTNQFFKRYVNFMNFSKEVSMKLKVRSHRELSADSGLIARWRITNDSQKVPRDIRGRLEPRQKGNEFIKKENAKYDGIHRAEVFVINDQRRIVAKGRYKVMKKEVL